MIYPKTNTFHMPFEEMTITLDDVLTLMDILVVDNFVSLHVKRLSDKDAIISFVSKSGVSRNQIAKELVGVRGQFVPMEWLRDLFSQVTDFNDGVQIECVAMLYLLFLLGCTIFCDTGAYDVSEAIK